MRCSTQFIAVQGLILGFCLLFGRSIAGEAWAQSATEAADAAINAETIVAVVDEKPITLGELIVVRQTLPEAFQILPDEVLLNSLIQMVIDEQILANAAEAANLQRSKRAKFALKNTTRGVLADAFVAESVQSGVTEDRIAAIYAETYVNADPIAQIRAAHILVDDQVLAQDLRGRLDEGVDFSTLAAEFGTDLTSTRGGDLGWQETGDLLPAFAEAVADMEPGQINGPIRSPFGWHIIRLDARRIKPVPTLDDMRETLRKNLETEVRKAAVSDARQAASIKILTESLPAGAIRNDALILP
ncbi:MAG: peptidylprolyl isomerase [Pseudomonadota bacterium]